jgi:Holliday junction DNA helicase RuvB
LNAAITPEGCHEIAKRCRGTPRVANRLLKRLRDYAQVKGTGEITRRWREADSSFSISMSTVSMRSTGSSASDRERFDGGPVGVGTIAAVLSEEVDAIEDIYEPYLLQIGFIQRTPRGRVASRLAYEHLGIPTRLRRRRCFEERWRI